MSFNAKRLRQARKRRGITRRDLARETGISERVLAYNECGERSPNEEQRRALADALGFLDEFFSRDDPELLPSDGVSFRSMSRMTARQRKRALAGAEMALELSAWLDEQFELPRPNLPDLRHQNEPEAAAAALRSYWCLGDRPIKNVLHLLEKRGVRVFSLAEDCESIDAFSFWKGDRPYVFLNTRKSGERSRFDAAHELGHLLLHSHGGPNGRRAEYEADDFAACFLMPRSHVIANQPTRKSLDGLIGAKKQWGVSVLALARRLHETGSLTDWHYRQICIQAQQLGLRKDEPNAIDRETSQVLRKTLTHLWSQRITPNQIAASFGWPRHELTALTFQCVSETRGSAGASSRSTLRLVRE